MRSFFQQYRFAGIICLVDVFIILGLITFAIINTFKTATIDILVAPKDATIIVGSKRYTNGTYRIFPGKTTVKISSKDFTTKEFTINLAKNETTKLHTYLDPQEGTIDKYATSDEDLFIIEQLNDSESNTLTQKMSIKDILPYTYIGVDSQTGYGIRFYVMQDTRNCPDRFCLKVINEANASKKFIQDTMKEKGYNLDDYEVFYN